VKKNNISQVLGNSLPTPALEISQEKIDQILKVDDSRAFKNIAFLKEASSLDDTEIIAPVISVMAGKGENIIYWAPVIKNASYKIYWSNKKGADKEKCGKIMGYSITSGTVHNKLIPDKAYYYRVTMTINAVEGELSNEVFAVPKKLD